jgi:hypothetical protein
MSLDFKSVIGRFEPLSTELTLSLSGQFDEWILAKSDPEPPFRANGWSAVGQFASVLNCLTVTHLKVVFVQRGNQHWPN